MRKKQKQEELVQLEFVQGEIQRTPMSQQKVYYGLHYRKIKNQWVGERLGCNSEHVMRHLVEKWKKEIDSDGFYMGEIVGNKYPEIPKYEDIKAVCV